VPPPIDDNPREKGGNSKTMGSLAKLLYLRQRLRDNLENTLTPPSNENSVYGRKNMKIQKKEHNDSNNS
jgi:hypothetical protein